MDVSTRTNMRDGNLHAEVAHANTGVKTKSIFLYVNFKYLNQLNNRAG